MDRLILVKLLFLLEISALCIYHYVVYLLVF